MTKININGTKLYYESHGSGQVVLFIHGLGSSAQDWQHQVGYFSKNYRVITVDLRGHGQSEKPAGVYSIPLLAKDIAGLMTQLGIAQLHVVGISLGGWVAYQLALDYPQLTRHLVVVNCLPELVAHSFHDRLELLKRTVLFRMLSMRNIGKLLGKRLFPKNSQRNLREIFTQRWAKNDKRAYMATMRGAIGWSVVDRIREINCPCCVISAEHDYFPVQQKQKFVYLMPKSKLVVVDDCGHALPIECPDEFNQILLDELQAN